MDVLAAFSRLRSAMSSPAPSIRDLLRPKAAKAQVPQFDPDAKLRGLVAVLNEAAGMALEVQNQACTMHNDTGLEISISVENDFDLLLSAVVARPAAEELPEMALFLLDTNVYARGTAGGWLALDAVSGCVVLHFRWTEFALGSGEVFLRLMELFLTKCEYMQELLRDGQWRAVFERCKQAVSTAGGAA